MNSPDNPYGVDRKNPFNCMQMFSMLIRWLFLLGLTLPASFLMAQSSVADEQLKLGVLAFRGEAQALQRWQPTLDYLNSHTPGQIFKLVPLSLQQIELAIERKAIDFVLTNTGQYVELESRYALIPLASLKNLSQQRYLNQFGAVIFTRTDSPIHTLKDLRDHQLAAVSKEAFGGFQMAWRELLEHGIDPFKDLGGLEFMGFPQDDIVYAVLQKRVDAGTVRSGLLENLAQQGKIKLNELRILNRQKPEGFPFLLSTELYPEWPFAALDHVPVELRSLVKAVLLDMPADHPQSAQSQHAGWSNQFDYRKVNELFKTLGLNQDKNSSKAELIGVAFVLSMTFTILLGYWLIFRFDSQNRLGNLLRVAAVLVFFLLSKWFIAQQLINEFEQQQSHDAHEVGQLLVQEIESTLARNKALTQQVVDKFASELLQPEELSGLITESIKEHIEPFTDDLELIALVKDQGHSLITDSAIPIGPDCRSSIHEFLLEPGQTFFDNVEVHGNAPKYHYDTMMRFGESGEHIFFAGYKLDGFSEYLNMAYKLGFEPIVVKRNNPTLIEFSADGIRHSAIFGQQLTLEQLDQSLFESAIEGSNWRLQMFPRSSLLQTFEWTLLKTFATTALLSLLLFAAAFFKLKKDSQEKRQLLDHAHTDPLTGLRNRRHLEQYFQQVKARALRHNDRFALMYIDLDGFKPVNDQLGHDIGDELLIQIAAKFEALVRSNELIARIGGDEFCLVIPVFKHESELDKSAQRLLNNMPKQFEIEHHNVDIGFSIGIAQYPEDGQNFNELLQKADEALYFVKRRGKGGFKRYADRWSQGGQS